MRSLLILLFVIFSQNILKAQDLFPLSIIHLNDIHARFEEVNMQANTCKNPDECIGGYARVVHMVKKLKATRQNSIYLNAADNFQGTLWYNVFRWNATQYFLNLLPADAMTLGNHEFDHGVPGLVPFMEMVAPYTPIVSCNIDATLEPTMAPYFNKSVVLNRGGKLIGIVGVTTTLDSDWGKAKVFPEVESVKAEVENLVSQGIKIIIVLSHSGFPVDREIAKNGGPIDLIVGGHSHSFLFTGPNPVGPDTPVSDYPTIVEQESGRKVLIVQASAYSKYLGDITLYFDDDGEVKNYTGAPIFLSHDIPQDEEVLEKLIPWKEELNDLQNRLIGKINHQLDVGCYTKECSMGNLVTDSMAWAFLKNAGQGEWTGAAIAIQGPGGMRTGLSPGKIIYADLVATTPFENTLVLVEIPGSTIRKALEFGVSNLSSLKVMQHSGIKVVYDLKREPYDRIIDLKVLCQKCLIPRYEPIDDEKIYKVSLTNYIADGGDGFTMFPEGEKSRVIGGRDIDALADYIIKFSPINMASQIGRSTFV